MSDLVKRLREPFRVAIMVAEGFDTWQFKEDIDRIRTEREEAADRITALERELGEVVTRAIHKEAKAAIEIKRLREAEE